MSIAAMKLLSDLTARVMKLLSDLTARVMTLEARERAQLEVNRSLAEEVRQLRKRVGELEFWK